MKLLFFKYKTDIFVILLICFVSVLSVVELFINKGQSANMDGIVHMMTPALFSEAIKMGEVPVSWVDGFANYGLPLGLIAHQLPTYLMAFINLAVNDPVLSFNIVGFIGILLSSIFLYFFLRIYVHPTYAFLGVFLFNFAPYRILNLYIRGAMPEFFASLFFPLILIAIYLLFSKRNIYGFFLLILSITLLLFTHPFMFIVSFFLVIPYIIFLWFSTENAIQTKLKRLGAIMLAIILGLGIASMYIFPLNREIIYFYYGLGKNHLVANNYLSLKNYFDPQWYYFTTINIFPRGFVVNVGIVETFVMISGVVYLLYTLLAKRKKFKITLLTYAVISGIIIIFFTTEYADFFYKEIDILSGIQFPWRVLSAFIFIPPLILAYLFNKYDLKFLAIILILLVAVIRFPQLYGKNYAVFPKSHYLFTELNLHATVMNPIWTERSEDYPVKSQKAEILEGEGLLQIKETTFSTRYYVMNNQTPVKMIDYTFYFPGWKVYIDGKEEVIEFQDPKYRGVITYKVPQGQHEISLRFEDTTTRKVGKAATAFFVVLTGILFIFKKRLSKFI